MSIPAPGPVRSDVGRPRWSIMVTIDRLDIRGLRDRVSAALAAGLTAHEAQIALLDCADGPRSEGDLELFRNECAARGVEFHRFEPRAKRAAVLNHCLQLARGHLVHILGQDDRVQAEFYRAAAGALEAAPDAGAFFAQHCDAGGPAKASRGYLRLQGGEGLFYEWPEYLVAGPAIPSLAVAVRRATYEQLGGFDSAYDGCAERDMWLRIAEERALWFDPRVLVEHRSAASEADRDVGRQLAERREARRWASEALARLSAPVRKRVGGSARRHLTGLAISECGRAARRFDLPTFVATLVDALANARPSDLAAIARRRQKAALVGRLPARPREANARRLPRILLLTEFYPADPRTCVFGVFQRLHTAVEALSQLGPVDALFFWPAHRLSPGDETLHAEAIKQHWQIAGFVRFVQAGSGPRRLSAQISDAFWALRGAVGFLNTAATMRTCGHKQSAALRKRLEELQPDLIFAQHLGGAAPLLRVGSELPPIVVDTDDLEHVKLARLADSTPDFWRRLGIRAEGALALHALRRVARIAACLLVASDLDQAKVRAAAPSASVAVVPNTGFSYGALPSAVDPVALFVGVAAYPPNREAMVWLIREIWPRVRDAVSGAQLVLAGEGTRELAEACSDTSVQGLGFVDDLAPLYRRARLALCPIRRGGGTRIKIIEAAMNARPVVSTRVGAEGLSLKLGSEILIEDSASGFAEACITLLRDPERASAIGGAAQRQVQSRYGREGVMRQLTALCAELLKRADAAALAPQPAELAEEPRTAIGQPAADRASGF